MAIKHLNGKMVLRRQLTPLVAPPTAPRAKNLGMIFKKSIDNLYKIPSEVEKQKKALLADEPLLGLSAGSV